MDLTILGSAAAEGWPALFCKCDACRQSLELGGKDIRRRTSYRLGDHIQIDWGPDTYAASVQFGLDTSILTDLIVTHRHEDHLAAFEFYYRRPGYSQVPEDSILRVHGPAGVVDAVRAKADDEAMFRLSFMPMNPYEERELSDGVVATALPASHGQDIGGAYNYIFRVGGERFLLGHDTGWWEDEVWEYLSGFRFNVVVMDCTYGARAERRGHLGCPDVAEVKNELAARGSLADGCQFIANHFSHNGYWLHEQLEEFFTPRGIGVGYDGMVVQI